MSKNKKEIQPFWRPNFVNQSELPDIKVIRTGFIINFVAVTIALCVMFFLLQREYRSYSLGNTISGMEQQIRVADADDVENLKLSESFRESAQYIIEVERFYDSPLLAHQFLLNLAAIKPDDLIFNSVSLSESTRKEGAKDVVAYDISIEGDAKNLTVLEEFKTILAERDLLNIEGFQVEIDETLQGRDERTGIFPYTIEVTLVPVKGKTASSDDDGDGEEDES